MSPQPSSSLDTRLTGTSRSRFLQEFFGNSAYFPIANILLEMLIEGPLVYLRAPDLYTILGASLLQAYWLSQWQVTSHPRRFWGNLIGPTAYTVIEALIEGPGFFLRPQHWAYWGFALALGSLQATRGRLTGAWNALALILENIVRTAILFVTYVIFEILSNPATTFSGVTFLNDPSHRFIAWLIPLVGLSVGLADLTAQRYLGLLQQTSAQLKTYSEWLLGRELLNRILANPNALTLARRERTVLFMDIRGFTRWSESRSPEVVVAMLDRYYLIAETVLNRHEVIKFKFSADEVMAVFAEAQAGVASARELQTEVQALLTTQALGVGIGLHTGPLVEGLLGSASVKFYDVIGDTVNTAKRIESAAQAAEVLVSAGLRQALGETTPLGEARTMAAKGKDEPLTVYPLT